MGDPEPLDLELLQAGDNNHIHRAIRELDLMGAAVGAVHQLIGANYGGDVERIARSAITVLFTDAIQGCNRIAGIRPLLITIARADALDFLDEAFTRHVDGGLDEQQLQVLFPGDGGEERPFEFLGNVIAEGLGLEEFDLAKVVPMLIEMCDLDSLEEALLIEHIIENVIQREFAQKHGLPPNGIGGRKERLLEKIRRELIRQIPRLRHILRRNVRRPPNI